MYVLFGAMTFFLEHPRSKKHKLHTVLKVGVSVNATQAIPSNKYPKWYKSSPTIYEVPTCTFDGHEHQFLWEMFKEL